MCVHKVLIENKVSILDNMPATDYRRLNINKINA